MSDYRVLLYYCFAPVDEPERLREEQISLCRGLGLRGRILVGPEGMNGTCGGSVEALREYQRAVECIRGFEDIEWKEEAVDAVPFRSLRVRVRDRIVNMGECGERLVPQRDGGDHLEPQEWKRFFDEEREFTLLDVRNEYEALVGRFRGAQVAPYRTFAEFPEWVERLDAPRDRPVLTYCTGGIRCEKFTGLLREAGFERVYQLRGGILNYATQVGGAHFQGKCYVFDDRVTVPVEGAEDVSLAECVRCGRATDRIRNCANMDCHSLVFICDDCLVPRRGCCSAACEAAPRLRKVDEDRGLTPWDARGREDFA